MRPIEDVRKKQLDFFNNSNSKSIARAKKYLESKGLTIEELMRTVENSEDLDKILEVIKGKDFTACKAEITRYLKSMTATGLPVATQAGHFAGFKNGFYVKKGSIPQMMFGCGTCPKFRRETCPHGGEHTNGGCSDRYMFFAENLKTYRGAVVPKMQEFLAELALKINDVSQRDSLKGDAVSKDYLALMKLIGEGMERLHKAQHGSKITVKKEITVKDIRRKFFEEGCEVVDVDAMIDEEMKES